MTELENTAEIDCIRQNQICKDTTIDLVKEIDANKEGIMEKWKVLDNEISVKTIDTKDFISLPDMLSSKDGEFLYPIG